MPAPVSYAKATIKGNPAYQNAVIIQTAKAKYGYGDRRANDTEKLQEVEDIVRQIQAKINSTGMEYEVTDVRSTQKRTVVIQSANKEDRNKLKPAVENQLGEVYDAKIPKTLRS